MPWRLIVIIIILGILMGFIGLNLTNTCDISLGFKVFYRVPVYLTVFASFILGMIISLPFMIFGGHKKGRKKEYQPEPEQTPDAVSPALPAKPKGLFKGKFSASKADKADENGPYGID